MIREQRLKVLLLQQRIDRYTSRMCPLLRYLALQPKCQYTDKFISCCFLSDQYFRICFSSPLTQASTVESCRRTAALRRESSASSDATK